MDTKGERLHYIRKLRGFTQESLAQAIGVSRGVIYNIEKDKTEIQAVVCNALCIALNIQKEWLIDGLGDMDCSAEVSHSQEILSELYSISKQLSEKERLFLLDVIKSMKKHFGDIQ